MPFTLLIIIMLVAISIPIVFVIRGKNHTVPISKTTANNLNHEPSKSKTINVNKLPNIYQQLLVDIEQQFVNIIQMNNDGKLTNELWFSANKMFYQRLPEILQDYLKLDKHFARNSIIDDQNQLTSYDITLQQLKSILSYFHQINQFSSQTNMQSILTNQRYLTALYDRVGMTSMLGNIQSNQDVSINVCKENEKFNSTDFIAGEQYINDYCTISPKFKNTLSKEFIAKTGDLVYLASITQIAIQEHLDYEMSKLNISSEYGLESLENLLAFNLPQDILHLENTSTTVAKLNQKIDVLKSLLEQMLGILDKDIRLDLKLNQLLDIDDKIWMMLKD